MPANLFRKLLSSCAAGLQTDDELGKCDFATSPLEHLLRCQEAALLLLTLNIQHVKRE